MQYHSQETDIDMICRPYQIPPALHVLVHVFVYVCVNT